MPRGVIVAHRTLNAVVKVQILMRQPSLIQKLLNSGKSWSEICEITGKTKSTVAYHALKQKMGKAVGPRNVHDWSKIREYSQDHTVRECAEKFGFSPGAWSMALKRGRVDRKFKPFSFSRVMTKDSKYPRGRLKYYILKYNLIENVCAICRMEPTWNGQKLTLRLDHINGTSNDHRRRNLRFVCPNCDSQLPTFCGRNIARVAK